MLQYKTISLQRHEVENRSNRLFSQALCRTRKCVNRATKMRTDEELRSCSWRNSASGKAQNLGNVQLQSGGLRFSSESVDSE